MNSISLKVDVYGGSDIEEACKDAIRLATQLNISIWFEFNGVECLARPNDDFKKLVASYHTEVASKKQYKIASTNEH